MSVVEQVRGIHPEYLFTYRGNPVQTINNSGWKTARKKVGLSQVRVHDLKHTFGRRLRAADVPLETRKVLLGHRNGDITTHYSAPELEELLAAVNKVCEEKSGRPFPVSSHVPNNPLIELAFSTRTVLGYD
jgi:integrase